MEGKYNTARCSGYRRLAVRTSAGLTVLRKRCGLLAAEKLDSDVSRFVVTKIEKLSDLCVIFLALDGVTDMFRVRQRITSQNSRSDLVQIRFDRVSETRGIAGYFEDFAIEIGTNLG